MIFSELNCNQYYCRWIVERERQLRGNSRFSTTYQHIIKTEQHPIPRVAGAIYIKYYMGLYFESSKTLLLGLQNKMAQNEICADCYC